MGRISRTFLAFSAAFAFVILASSLPDFVTWAWAQSSAGVPSGGYATPGQVQDAIQSAVPKPSTAMPPATALDGTPGGSVAYARADHTHAARIQRTALVTASDGTLTWMFARPIACDAGKVPPISYMVEDAGTPVVVQITARTFTTADGKDTHTAVTVKAQRSRVLPAALVSLAALLNFDVFGAAAGSVRVNLFAADPTQ